MKTTKISNKKRTSVILQEDNHWINEIFKNIMLFIGEGALEITFQDDDEYMIYEKGGSTF